MNGLHKKVFILSMLSGIYITSAKYEKQRISEKYVCLKSQAIPNTLDL